MGLITNGGFERHRRRATKALTLRRQALLAGLARHAGDRLTVTDSKAGMHLVAWLRHASEAQETALIDFARQAGLGLHPLSAHFSRGPRRRGLLLGYAGVAPAQITRACELLGRCLARL